MFCSNCGTKIVEKAEFCQNCGESTSALSSGAMTGISTNQVEVKPTNTIKCGNCNYIGQGEPGRRLFSQILAWICVVILPLITIIYFLTTSKYRCPRCKSTFLGIKNKEGVFVGQKVGPVMIIVWVFVGIIIMAILSTIVIAGLQSAREKGRQATDAYNNGLIR